MCSCVYVERFTRPLTDLSPNTPANNALRAKSRKRQGGKQRSRFLHSAGGEGAFDHMQIPHRGYRCLRGQTKPLIVDQLFAFELLRLRVLGFRKVTRCGESMTSAPVGLN